MIKLGISARFTCIIESLLKTAHWILLIFSKELEVNSGHILPKFACQKDFPFLRYFGKGAVIWVPYICHRKRVA